ncbi:MAG: type IV secretion system protein, partial [Citromicrobium sp.]|nr:type IV secretion system protein [Citromicrobium sp.]
MTGGGTCDLAMSEAAGGVAAALEAVNCVAAEVTGATFGRLFAPGGILVSALTIILTLYVAFFAINLLTGRSVLGVRALTPRMITLGLVLTFATSWVAYQSVVWGVFVDGPDWLASALTGDSGSATQTFATKVDVVFAAVQQASEGQEDIQTFSPAGMLWLGALLFMLGTVGLLVTTRIALALLIALGPIFVVMALFDGTRGLFVGWLKGVTMMALTPLFAVLGGSIMLEMSVPILAALNQVPGEIPARAAMAFFMIGAVHVALMAMALKVMGTMVGGWQVFGLASSDSDKGRGSVPAAAPAPAASNAY